jgi:hypothetical protein
LVRAAVPIPRDLRVEAEMIGQRDVDSRRHAECKRSGEGRSVAGYSGSAFGILRPMMGGFTRNQPAESS